MKKLTSLGVAAFAALIAVLATLAAQSPAQAYPEVQIGLKVDRQVLYGGQKFTATASSNVHCSWTLDWNGKVRKGSSSDHLDFQTTYTAAAVTHTTKIPLHGACVYSSSEAPGARASATWRHTIVITVLPRSSAVSPPGGSDLPNTGGPDWKILAGGLVLLLSGATAVTVARRRAEEAEIQASKA
jgi:LPXTG-motif cell wall-anchored protein